MKDEILKYIDILINNAKESLSQLTSEDSDAITAFYNWFQADELNWNTFKEIYLMIDKVKLNPIERQYLDELYRVITLFDENEYIKLDSDILEKFVNNAIFVSTRSTVIHFYGEMIKRASKYQTFESLKNYWEQFREKIVNLPSDKYIDNLGEFNDYLYRDKADLKLVKIPLLYLIFQYNMSVGNNNYKELSTQFSSMKVDISEVIEIFKRYGYDFTKVKEEIKNNILMNCTSDDIVTVLEFYKKYNIRFDIAKDDKYLIILYKTNKEILDKIEEFVSKYHISMSVFLRKTPSAFSFKNGNGLGEGGKGIPSDGISFAGSFQDFSENITFIESLGYDVEESYRTCPSIFVYSASQLKKNVEALKAYGIDVAKDHDSIKLSGLRSSKILQTIDQFVELGELEYLKQNTSRLQLEPDSFIFYRLYYVKKYNRTNLDRIEYHGRMKHDKITYKNAIVNINDTTLGINNENRQARVNAIESSVLPEDVKKAVDKFIEDSDNSSYDPEILQDPEVLFFENNFYYDDISYNIAGKVIARLKFLRLYSSLRNSGLANNHELALYVLTYNTIMSPEEYELMMETIESYGRGLE